MCRGDLCVLKLRGTAASLEVTHPRVPNTFFKMFSTYVFKGRANCYIFHFLSFCFLYSNANLVFSPCIIFSFAIAYMRLFMFVYVCSIFRNDFRGVFSFCIFKLIILITMAYHNFGPSLDKLVRS